MARWFSVPTLLYSVVASAAISAAALALTFVEALTYQVVVVFITLIILSNCVAKLYGRLILKEDL